MRQTRARLRGFSSGVVGTLHTQGKQIGPSVVDERGVGGVARASEARTRVPAVPPASHSRQRALRIRPHHGPSTSMTRRRWHGNGASSTRLRHQPFGAVRAHARVRTGRQYGVARTLEAHAAPRTGPPLSRAAAAARGGGGTRRARRHRRRRARQAPGGRARPRDRRRGRALDGSRRRPGPAGCRSAGAASSATTSTRCGTGRAAPLMGGTPVSAVLLMSAVCSFAPHLSAEGDRRGTHSMTAQYRCR